MKGIRAASACRMHPLVPFHTLTAPAVAALAVVGALQSQAGHGRRAALVYAVRQVAGGCSKGCMRARQLLANGRTKPTAPPLPRCSAAHPISFLPYQSGSTCCPSLARPGRFHRWQSWSSTLGWRPCRRGLQQHQRAQVSRAEPLPHASTVHQGTQLGAGQLARVSAQQPTFASGAALLVDKVVLV